MVTFQIDDCSVITKGFIVVDEFKCYFQCNTLEEAQDAVNEHYPFASIKRNDPTSPTCWIPGERVDREVDFEDERPDYGFDPDEDNY